MSENTYQTDMDFLAYPFPVWLNAKNIVRCHIDSDTLVRVSALMTLTRWVPSRDVELCPMLLRAQMSTSSTIPGAGYIRKSENALHPLDHVMFF